MFQLAVRVTRVVETRLGMEGEAQHASDEEGTGARWMGQRPRRDVPQSTGRATVLAVSQRPRNLASEQDEIDELQFLRQHPALEVSRIDARNEPKTPVK